MINGSIPSVLIRNTAECYLNNELGQVLTVRGVEGGGGDREWC